MAKALPPPPVDPTVSPPIRVADEETLTIPGLSGEPALEGLIRTPCASKRAVVLCHPHPLYGGTMHSAVIVAVTKMLVATGGDRVATLRFNFRGVGASEGHYGEGKGEVLDVRAAIRVLHERAPAAKLTLCGYSFGTYVGLRGAVLEGGVEGVALVAPAVRVFAFAREDGAAFAGKIAIFVGDRDEFCSKDEAEALARDLGATLTILEGNDHFFLRSRRKLAEAVVPFVAPEIGAP